MVRHPVGLVRTVTGDITSDQLGATNYHEHFFQVSPALRGDELDDEQASTVEAKLVAAGGIAAVVDATPIGLGRQPEALARISRESGLHIIATAGVHREVHYAADHWLRELTEDQLTARLFNELQVGQPPTDDPDPSGSTTTVRAGMLKFGIGYWSISPFERRNGIAVAAAHRATGAPVMVHLESSTAAHEVLDFLDEHGVAESSVLLAHVDRSPDKYLWCELADRGAYLGCDGAARLKTQPESMIFQTIADVAAAGYPHSLLLGGDVARRSRYTGYGGMPGISYLTERFIPRLTRAIGETTVRQIMVDNPAAALTWVRCGDPRRDAN